MNHHHPFAERLGIVVSGSLTKGLDIKLDQDVPVEEMAVGRFVTIDGQRMRFFGVMTDIELASTDERMPFMPPDVENPFVARVVLGTSAFGIIHVAPYLTLGEESLDAGPLPAKTVPEHFSVARTSDPGEVQLIFGDNDDRHVWLGSPLDMEEVPLCLDIRRLTERSTGVFGKTGTGKSFLTRILLAEIIKKSETPSRRGGERSAVALIFDMHSEYGWSHRSESGTEVKGLKQLFPSRVGVFTLDPNSARARGVSADFDIQIGFDEITADDVVTLAGTLGLSETMVQAAYRMERQLGGGWVKKFLSAESRQDIGAMAGDIEHEGTVAALRRKLGVLERFEFLTNGDHESSVVRIMADLDRGKNVVLEFGRYASNLSAYILVANLLTRRIHGQYVDRMERALGKSGEEPRPLIIAIEEAHKFLGPDLSGQTAFGTIARELRKYNVTLLVIDQRPSGIDSEVMSQLGTKMTCLLENDRDIDAVLAGVAGRGELRAVLAKLETKQQALVFGHAVPMPVVVRTRSYDTEFYRSIGFQEPAERRERMERDLGDLF